jgi:5-deoxy-glucuronate isomerase
MTTRATPVVRDLVVRGRDADELSLAVAELRAGETLERSDGDELVAVVLDGVVDANVGGEDLGRAGGRSEPFSSPGHAVYAPAPAPLGLTAVTETARVAVVGAAPGDAPGGPARIIGPGDQTVATVGRGNWERTVRTIVGPNQPAARLLVGETINPPGNWSSYPPHKHDEQRPPDEVSLEEVYFFKVEPDGGFGIQLLYEPGSEQAFTVRDGDVAVIRSGYHPVAAAPGYRLYYLWALAGEGRELIPWFDPQHAWVQER